MLQSQLNELPIEILQVIMSKGETCDTITHFMQTSKENAKKLTKFLREPGFLFTLLCGLPPNEVFKLIQTHYSPESGNYKAIEQAATSKKHHLAIICFPFITKDVTALDWSLIQKSLEILKSDWQASKENINKPFPLEKSLKDMQAILETQPTKPLHIQGRHTLPINHNGYLNLSGSELHGYRNLHTFNLRWVNLGNANLYLANGKNIDLSQTGLSGTILENTKFDSANLSGSNLSFAKLNQAKFRWSNFSETNLSETCLDQAELNGSNFHKAVFYKASMINTFFNGASLIAAKLHFSNLERANLRMADFSNAELNHANLKKAELLKTNFSNANLNHANLTSTSCGWANFSGANLTHADFCGANLENADLSGATLTHTNFNGAKLINTTFLSGIDLQDEDHLKNKLSEFDTVEWLDSTSLQTVKQAILTQLLKSNNINLLELAYDHPFFSRHRDISTLRGAINASAKKAGQFFGSTSSSSLIETKSQELIRAHINELKLLQKNKNTS